MLFDGSIFLYVKQINYLSNDILTISMKHTNPKYNMSANVQQGKRVILAQGKSLSQGIRWLV